MNVLVVGAGAMGRWFARTVRDAAAVAFTDTDPSVARAAADAVDGRAVPTDTDEAFDVVCIAVPMPAARVAIEQYGPLAADAVVDVTGSMRDPVAAMREAAPDAARMSLHPLFAPDNAPGNVAVVTDSGDETTDALLDVLREAGCDCFETTPAEHDEAMQTVQAGAHTAILAFALAADSVPDEFQTPVSQGLYDLVEQVTGGDPHVYADIQRAFDGAEPVADAAGRIADADYEEFQRLYDALS